MFMNNAIMFWRYTYKAESPDETVFVGSFPDDEPKHHVWNITWGDNTTYIVISENPDNLVIRAADEVEVEALCEYGELTAPEEPEEEDE
jgi:hypothetical protein